MIIDNHVHMGWYSNGYHSPVEVWLALKKAGIDKCAVSSTSTCAELYNNIKTEFCQLMAIAGQENIFPILWITPLMIKKEWPLKKLIHSKIEWRGIKLHFLANREFYSNPTLVLKVVDLSYSLGNLPILLHTGEWKYCHAGYFENLISHNPGIKFILAHGRPLNELLSLMKKYNNVWTDCSFMPEEHLKTLCNHSLTERILFGTDAPVNTVYYPFLLTEDFIKNKIIEVCRVDKVILSNKIY